MLARLLPFALAVAQVSAYALRPPPKVSSPDFVREADIKHGRVAMTASAVRTALASTGVEHPSMVLAPLPVGDQLAVFSAVGTLEPATYFPRLTSRFSLKNEVEPGKFWNNTVDTEVDDVVGRLAMCGVVAFLVTDVLYAYQT